MKKFLYICGIFFTGLFVVLLYAEKEEALPSAVFDKDFMRVLSSTRVIERNLIFEKPLNKIVQGRGVIISSDKKGRYKRNFRFILEDKTAAVYKMNITYNIFFNREETAAILSVGDVFEFRGQLISYVPANIGRSAYIVDIVLEEGTLIFE